MAFEIVAGLCVTYLGIAGFIAYFSLFGVDIYASLEADRFYAKSAYIENHLVYPMVRCPYFLSSLPLSCTFISESFINY